MKLWVAIAGVVCVPLLVFSMVLPQQVGVTGRVEVSSGGRPGDPSGAVVWLMPVGESTVAPPAKPASAQLLQKNKTFSPHLLVVQVGAPVEFPNQDPFFHNVFSLFDGKRFDLGLYESGSTRRVVFNRAGVSYIFCNIHPEMSAVVVALNTPYYAVSDRKGNIIIPSLTSGRYEVRVWHERVAPEMLNSQTRTISISSGSNSLGLIQLPEQRNLIQAHKNKYGRDYDSDSSNSPIYSRP